MSYLLATWGNVLGTPPARRIHRAVLGLAFLTVCCRGAWAQDEAPEPEDYRSLWKGGAYHEALEVLDGKLEQYGANTPFSWARERAELRFLTGGIDAAIADYEELSEFLRDAPTTLRLAELYKYRGRLEEYEDTLKSAARRVQASWGYSSQEEYLLAAGRIAELQGEDPKKILSTIYKLIIDNRPSFAKARVAAGDLAFSKGSFDIAARYYGEGIEQDPEQQDALAGLAACYWESRDERLGETLERIEALNPNQPRANAIQVEMALDAGDTPSAMPLIKNMLDINPNQLQFLAYKAAAQFLEDDEAGMAATQARALEFNPHCSEVYRVPGRIASRHYRFQEGAAMQRKALDVDRTDYAAQALLGFDLLRLGEDDAGREALDAAFQADPYNVRVYNSLEVMDKLKGFKTVTRGAYAVTLPEEEAPILAESALDLLEEEGALMQAKYDITLKTPVRVQIFSNHDDFIVRSVGLPGSTGHMGICFGQLITMDSPTARPKGSMDWHSVLWHEFVHVVTLQKTKNRMPRWLSEGVSVYEETRRNPAWGMKLDPAQRELIDPEKLPKVSELELWFTQPKTSNHLMFGYFLAGEFVLQYAGNHGEATLVDALARIGNKEDTLAALADAAGIKAGKLNSEFQAHLEKRLAAFEQLEAFGRAMRAGLEAEAKEDWEEAIARYREAHTLFPEYGAEDGPLTRLTAIFSARKQDAELREVLVKQLAFETTNLRAWRRLAELTEADKDWPALARVATSTEAIVPYDTGFAAQLLRARQALGEKEEALETAKRLMFLEPAQAAEHQMTCAELLMDLERWEEAKQEVVRVLEEKPHYWKAQEVLLALVERQNE